MRQTPELPRKPRVLHVCARLDARLGGAAAAAVAMSCALAERGFDVTLVSTCSEDDDAYLLRTSVDGVHYLTFRRTRGMPYSHSRALAAWLTRNASTYDLIEIHGIFDFPAMTAARVARRLRVPYAVHPHGSLDPFDLRKHRLLKRAVGPLLVQPMLSAAACVFATAQREAERLQTFGASARIDVLPVPYRVSGTGADPLQFRRRYGLGDGPLILFLGRVDYKKGLTYVIDALAEVRRSCPGTRLVIAGNDSGPYARQLKARVVKSGLAGAVKFVGMLGPAAKNSSLAASDLLVLVSENEVLVEAAWWGLPMVISHEVYIGSLLEAAGAAVVVDRRPSSVAAALIRLLTDADLRSQFGDSARRLARTELSWEVCAAEHADARRSVLAASRRPRA